MTVPAKIQVESLTMKYDNDVVFENLDLDVYMNEVVCLVGPSGCGKSTLLRGIAGLHEPSSGEIRVDDGVIDGPGSDRVMVFQEDAVFPWMTVQHNVEIGLKWKGVNRSDRAEIVRKTISLVGLSGTEEMYPRQLSGGMRKRVDLARALAVSPVTLLMDEPYAALDEMTKERLQVEFLGLLKAQEMTAVFVTHDLEEALFVGDRVVVVGSDPGRIESVIKVPFTGDRPVSLKRSAEFQRLRGQISDALEAAHGGGALEVGSSKRAHHEREIVGPH